MFNAWAEISLKQHSLRMYTYENWAGYARLMTLKPFKGVNNNDDNHTDSDDDNDDGCGDNNDDDDNNDTVNRINLSIIL